MTRLAPASGLAVIWEETAVYVAHLPNGPIVVLDGVAGLIWAAACGGEREAIAARVAAAIEPPVDGIDRHINEFVASLLDRGLLSVLHD